MAQRRRKRDREEFEQQLAREAAAKGEALGEIPSTQERARSRRRLAFEPSDDLTQEQKEVLAAVRAGENVFFTGGAGENGAAPRADATLAAVSSQLIRLRQLNPGTGKTFTLHELQRMCSDATVHTVASTAIAACPLGELILPLSPREQPSTPAHLCAWGVDVTRQVAQHCMLLLALGEQQHSILLSQLSCVNLQLFNGTRVVVVGVALLAHFAHNSHTPCRQLAHCNDADSR